MLNSMLQGFWGRDFLIFLLPDRLLLRSGNSGPLQRGAVCREFPCSSWSELQVLLHRLPRMLSFPLDGRWCLGLPLRHFTLLNFSLPKAAQENLHQAVLYGLMRHVAFDLQGAYLNYRKIEQQESLRISAVLAPEAGLKPYLDLFASAGMPLSWVFPYLAFWAHKLGDGAYVLQEGSYIEALVYQNQEFVLQNWEQAAAPGRQPPLASTAALIENLAQIPAVLWVCDTGQSPAQVEQHLGLGFGKKQALDMAQEPLFSPGTVQNQAWAVSVLSPTAARRQKSLSLVFLAALIFLLLSLAAWPAYKLAGQRSYLHSLEQEVQTLDKEAEEIRQLRQENSAMLQQFKKLAEMRSSHFRSLGLLLELSRIIPDSAWLSSFGWVGAELSLQGEADSAARVIRALEESGLFQADSANFQVSGAGEKDIFNLQARVQE